MNSLIRDVEFDIDTRYTYFNLAFLNIKYFKCYRLGFVYMALPKGKNTATHRLQRFSCFARAIYDAKSIE